VKINTTEQDRNQEAILLAAVNRSLGALNEDDQADLGLALFTKQAGDLCDWVKKEERFSGIQSLFGQDGTLHKATKSAMLELIYSDQA